jgi:secondary thiamine-phosphate synthase enzyme
MWSAREVVGMGTFTVTTEQPISVVDITDRVAGALPADADGTATVFVQHTTAGIAVNEAERRLLGDFETALAELVPDDGWTHDEIDDNADAHVRALLVGPSETVPVEDGTLALGTWQSILLVECDGPRTRTVRVER